MEGLLCNILIKCILSEIKIYFSLLNNVVLLEYFL